MAGLKVVVQPTSEPVTVSQILSQLKYDDDIVTPELTQQINDLIASAREWCEGHQNRAYMTQTIEVALDCWPCGNEIPLPRPPLKEVVSLEYTNDGAIAIADPDNYTVDDFSFIPRIVARSWPGGRLPEANGIIVRYVAGWINADAVPHRIKQAIILLTVHWYENGMCEPPPAIYRLLNLDRVIPV